ncbi:MAG: membrane-bound lytic murein transglycosylase MltF [Desulfobacteraceae bacterium]|nr:MAG: membrane-bound lytic murein transglycosylase MltF [Desulfobacteraceae bacterium]
MHLKTAINGFRNENPRLFNTIIIFLFISFCVFAVLEKNSENNSLRHILKKGEITLITQNNAHCFYIYRDQPAGFEYELAKAFAEYLGVKLKVQIIEKWEDLIPALKDSSGAFIAASMTASPERKKTAAFSDGYMRVRQHIIVNKKNRDIQKQEDLAGHTVHVRKGMPYEEQLKKLQTRGINLKIALHEGIATEELIRDVARNEIEATVAYSNVAYLNRRYYPSVTVTGAISEYESLVWAVDKSALSLVSRINSFFKTIKANGKFAEIYNRYYSGIDSFDNVDVSYFYAMMQLWFPLYSQTIKDAAAKYGFDWRLIAAQAYQESHFDPLAQSHAGAHGLMQITEQTAFGLGFMDFYDPEKNIYAGVKHLKNLYNLYDRAAGLDRLLIALAAYNIGEGHIMDARDLAVKKNLNPNNWASLSRVLPLLSEQRYYSRTKYGYCRGIEAVNYINQIMNYYDILKNQVIEFNAADFLP